jgi:hypothetical protein
MPPNIVQKRKTLPKRNVRGIILQAQESGWMNQSLVVDWIKRVLQRHPGALLNLNNSMLVLYIFWGHTLDEVKTILKNGETDLAIIPDGLTSLLLPLGVCINQPLKAS